MSQLELWQVDGAWLTFALTYSALAFGYVPWFRLDRTGATFVGAVLMVAMGVLTSEQAFQAQDHETLVLLFSMMIIVSFLVNSGIIGRVQQLLLSLISSPRSMLWSTVGLSGLLSALFINDVVCLMLTPIVLTCAGRLGYNPIPHLLAVAMASNLGSMMTPVGNPQNIYIASVGRIGYVEFVGALFPVAVAGLVVLGLVLEAAFRGQWLGERVEQEHEQQLPPIVPYVAIRTFVVLVGILAAFWLGYPLGKVASAGAAFLMVTRRISRQQLFAFIDWDLLVLFVGLFVLTAGAQQAGILEWFYQEMAPLRPEKPLSLAFITLVMSNLFSNVPAVFFLAKFIARFSDPKSCYLLVAMVSTLAGNLTLLGSIANLIVAEKAAPRVQLDFWTYTRIGLPVTALTLLVGLIYWRLRFGL